MLNTVAIMGRLVAEPELKQTPNGVSVTTFTIACDRSYAKPGAERQTDFLDVVAWRGTAEFVCRYFRKGQLIAANGSLQTRTYEDKNGNKRKVYEIVADNVHFAEGRRDGSQQNVRPAPVDERGLTIGGDSEDFTVISDDDDLPF